MSLSYTADRDEDGEDVLYEWHGYFKDELNLRSFPVFSGRNIVKVAVGGGHSLFLTADSLVYGSGKNDKGQLALPQGELYEEPQVINSLSDKNILELSCGVSHSAAMSHDGDVYCWGDNSHSQCGVEKEEKVAEPTLIPITHTGKTCEHGVEGHGGKVSVKDVSCGAGHTLALDHEGQVWSWGEGVQLGLGDTSRTVRPCLVQTLQGKNVVKIRCGHSHCLALIARSQPRTKRPISEARYSGDVQSLTQKYYPSRCAECNTEIYTYTDTSDTCIIDEYHVCKDSTAEVDKSIDSLGDSFTSSAQSDLKSSAISEGSAMGTSCGSKMTDEDKIVEEGEQMEDEGRTDTPTSSSNLDEAEKENVQESEKPTTPTNLQPSEEPPKSVDTDQSNSANIEEADNNSPSKEPSKPEVPKDLNLALHSVDQISGIKDTSSPNEESKSVVASKEKDSNEDSTKIPGGLACENKTLHKSAVATPVEEEMEEVWQKAPTPAETKNIPLKSTTQPIPINKPGEEEKPEDSGSFRSKFGGFLPYSSGIMQNIKSATSKAFTNLQSQISYVTNAGSGSESPSKSLSQEFLEQEGASSVPDSVHFPLSCDSVDTSSRASRSKESSPVKEWSPENDRVSKKPQSIRTLMARQEQMDKRASKTSLDDEMASSLPVVIDTELWVWGRNNKGQLGLGDNVDRNKPTCIKMMNGKEVVVIAAGHSHSVVATANSQVYTWGNNGYLQLGHNETAATPCRVKFMKGCYVWDVAAGDSYSVFLADSSGMKPAVFYCGKHTSKEPNAPLKKTMNPTIILPLKQCGWVREIEAGGEKCVCLVKPGDAVNVTFFEFASSERGFYQQLNRIINAFIKPLQKSDFYTSLDVFPYKSCLQCLIQEFIDLSKKIGEGIAEVSEIMRENKNIFEAGIISNYSRYIQAFKQYSDVYCNMLAVGGFEYFGKVGSSFFDECKNIFPDLIADKTADKTNYATAFRRTMEYPFTRVKLDYRRLFSKLAENLQQDTDERHAVNRAVLNWESLKMMVTSDHRVADTTRAFWESAHPKISDALRTPGRRLLRDSKNNPLMLPSAGRFSSHTIVLFNDGFVHTQSTVFQLYPLSTLWAESHSSETEQQNVIVVTTPEDTLTLVTSTSEEKADWLMMLNEAINKELSSQKSVSRRNSAERLTPPLIRHVLHQFTKHCLYKDAVYKGFMLNGKVHGSGEMSWPDGKKYIGQFSQGLQQGHGKLILPCEDGLEVLEGSWKDGKMMGYGTVEYANGDKYNGFFKNGQRFGHGVYRKGQHLTSSASIYIGEWLNDKRHGYGVQDDMLKGEKYMGMWQDDCCHGNGVVVTLDGMYFEGNFVQNKLTGFGLMLTDDSSCYEGEFQGVTLLQGKGCLTLPSGDKLDGTFNGTWNEGLKINGTFIKASDSTQSTAKPKSHWLDISNKTYGKLSVPADRKWTDIFKHTLATLGYQESKNNPSKAWEVVAVKLTKGQNMVKELEKKSPTKAKTYRTSLDNLQTIPPYNTGNLSIESYNSIAAYLQRAFENPYHPLGNLMDGIVDVFRAAYIGIGAHPRLLHHAVQEIKSYVKRIYFVVRVLFPDLPSSTGPVSIYSEKSHKTTGIPLSTEAAEALLHEHSADDDEPCEVISAAGLLYPILLPNIYPPLSDLYALYNDKDDELCWERVTKLNRQGDMALMAYLGIEEKFWLMKEVLLQDKSHKLSTTRDQCYASAVDTLQQLSTAFSPIDKLRVIEKTFQEISETVQASLEDDHVWCMDDLFPIFQFVVVRAKIRHLGAEVHMIDDLMEKHLEFGELGMMFTILKACYFQIQNEKLPHH